MLNNEYSFDKNVGLQLHEGKMNIYFLLEKVFTLIISLIG